MTIKRSLILHSIPIFHILKVNHEFLHVVTSVDVPHKDQNTKQTNKQTTHLHHMCMCVLTTTPPQLSCWCLAET